jgi:hypothetical protein
MSSDLNLKNISEFSTSDEGNIPFTEISIRAVRDRNGHEKNCLFKVSENLKVDRKPNLG